MFQKKSNPNKSYSALREQNRRGINLRVSLLTLFFCLLSALAFAYTPTVGTISPLSGSTVITEYETDFYAYPIKVTNSLGHTITYVYDPKFGVVTSVTDANGNMTVGKNKTLGYDIENRLTQVNELGTTSIFIYDGDGGRVLKTTDDGKGTTNSTTYIGSLYEVDSSGKITKHIFAGSNRVATVNTQTGSPANPQTFYYHTDHLGSSSIITDASGAQVQYLEYTPYGSLVRNEGTDVVKHKFTGKELDETGLYFYGARYYDPEIGRFISADTIVQAPYNPQASLCI